MLEMKLMAANTKNKRKASTSRAQKHAQEREESNQEMWEMPNADARSWSITRLRRVLESHLNHTVVSKSAKSHSTTLLHITRPVARVIRSSQACAIGHPSATYSFATQYELKLHTIRAFSALTRRNKRFRHKRFLKHTACNHSRNKHYYYNQIIQKRNTTTTRWNTLKTFDSPN